MAKPQDGKGAASAKRAANAKGPAGATGAASGSDGGASASSPLADALRVLQDVGGRLTASAAKLADDVIESPAGPFVEPLARIGAQAAELSTAWVTPVKAILDEQQELVDALAAWSEQQRVLAERFSSLAERHRALTAQTMSVLGPLLDQVEQLGQVGQRRRPDPGSA